MTELSTRLLVVGGNGFIGSHIVNRAVGLGWRVTSLSERAGGEDVLPGVREVSADISDADALGEALGDAEYEYVVNCGGYIDHTLYSSGGRRVCDVHFVGVLNLVEALDRDALRGFVNLGSADEYGSAPAPQIETQREAPISPYSLGKVAATHFLQMLHRSEGFPATTLRLFLTYGPGQDVRRFLPQIIVACIEGRSFPTSGGQQLRDFCFVGDTVDAVFTALEALPAKGEVINIASGRPVSIREMIETVRRMIGRGEPRVGEIPYRPGENMALFGDIAKADELLGWKAGVSLEVGLSDTIRGLRR
jgi:nucleoside-diphosphate-sugar epimerase